MSHAVDPVPAPSSASGIALVIDTSASLCAAGVFENGRDLGRDVIDIGKGHAEHLMAVIGRALSAAGKAYADLSRVVIAVGPGSFTGIRVGVATARGLSLALKIPAVGITNLEAVAADAQVEHPGRAVLVAFASARADLQVAVYDPSAQLLRDPTIMGSDEAIALAVRHQALLAGSAASQLAALKPALEIARLDVTADIATFARLGAARQPGDKPTPLYLREPDAKPQAGFAVARVAS